MSHSENHPNSESECGVTRRNFLSLLGGAAAVGIAAGVAKSRSSHAGEPGDNKMQYRLLGDTGEKVSMVGLGGFHIGKQPDEQDSIRIIRTGIDNGINFMDNAWDYNEGQSEIRMGKALKDGYRQKVFLMTKIDGRTKKSANDQLEESLKRLQTDVIDLIQIHEVIRMSDPEKVFAPGGGIEALIEARKAGKVRYIGFTGHKSPEIHLKMLETAFVNNFKFDTCQMPLNVMDAHYDSFGKKVLPVLVQHKIGVLGMKSMGDQIILKSNTVSATECLHYAMNLPTSVVITGCDSLPILEQALNAARTFKPMDEKQVAELLAKTEAAAKNGKYEHYKITGEFDSTAKHPEWLG